MTNKDPLTGQEDTPQPYDSLTNPQLTDEQRLQAEKDMLEANLTPRTAIDAARESLENRGTLVEEPHRGSQQEGHNR